MYNRKTKDIYILVWNREEIDEAETRAEAARLKTEYALAFHCSAGAITIKKRRVLK